MDFHRIYAKIDLDAIAHNIKVIKNKIGGAKLMFVIKADAYGHGAVPLATFVEPYDYLWGFATDTERTDFRGNLRKAPIISPLRRCARRSICALRE